MLQWMRVPLRDICGDDERLSHGPHKPVYVGSTPTFRNRPFKASKTIKKEASIRDVAQSGSVLSLDLSGYSFESNHPDTSIRKITF